MVQQPGFIDEGGGHVQPETVTNTTAALAAASPPPMLIDVAEKTPGDRIDHGWAPEMIKPVRVGRGSLFWVTSGLVVLIVGWIVSSASALVYDQFARSARLGAVTLAVFVAATGLILRGVVTEVGTYVALRRIDSIRDALVSSNVLLVDAKRLCGYWIDVVAPHLPDPAVARNSLAAASDLIELKAALRNRVLMPLDRAARRVARIGALQGAASVAIIPSPAFEAVLIGLRGLILVRQVAQVYGVRPGFAVTLSLLQRVSLTAAGIAGVEFLAQTAAEKFLHGVPIVKRIAETVPETSLATLRLYRLGMITAKACSPLAED